MEKFKTTYTLEFWDTEDQEWYIWGSGMTAETTRRTTKDILDTNHACRITTDHVPHRTVIVIGDLGQIMEIN